MISEAQFQNELEQIIKNAIREDVGSGDYSSLSCIPTTNIWQSPKSTNWTKERESHLNLKEEENL